MARNVRLQELLVGIEGLALLRHLYDGTDEEAGRRLAEVRELLADERLEADEPISEVDPRAGYGSWSARYDEPGNPIVELEEPAVRALVAARTPGRALDAACGTGRHARHLVELGHAVVGIDLTPEMLDRARIAVPHARFVEADLRDIPAEAGQFALVVSGLALAHVADLSPAVAELARVLAPGGHLVVSVLHPFQSRLGGQAPFEDDDGARRFVREHPHGHADYVEAFTSAGLSIRRCVEPALSAVEVRAKRRAFGRIPEATAAAYVGLPAVLIWEVEKA